MIDWHAVRIHEELVLDEWTAGPLSRLEAGKWARAAAAEKAAAAGPIRREGAWNVMPGIAILRREDAKHKTRTVPALRLIGRGTEKIVRDTKRRVVLKIRDRRRGTIFEDGRFLSFQRAPMPRLHGEPHWHASEPWKHNPAQFKACFHDENEKAILAEAKRRTTERERAKKKAEEEWKERERRKHLEWGAWLQYWKADAEERKRLFPMLPQSAKASLCLGVNAGEETSARQKTRTLLALGIVAG